MSKVKDGCECSDNKEKTRRELVAALLKDAYFESPEDKLFAAESYFKSTLSIEEINALVAPLREISSSVKDRKFKIFGSNNTAGYGVAGIQ